MPFQIPNSHLINNFLIHILLFRLSLNEEIDSGDFNQTRIENQKYTVNKPKTQK
jgi:hypothetical protein